MLNQVVEARAPLSITIIVSAVLGLTMLLIGALLPLFSLAIGGMFPLSLALILWLRRTRGRTISIEQDRLVDMEGKWNLEYSAISAVYLNGNSNLSAVDQFSPGPIHIVTGNQVIFLPAKMNVDSVALFEFLSSRLPPKLTQLLPSLEEHVRDEQEKFGKNKVVVINQRPRALKWRKTGAGVLASETFILTGLAWLAIGATLSNIRDKQVGRDEFEAWMIFGFISVIIAGMFRLLFAISGNRETKHRGKYGPASIVISPTGLAMDQGDLKGKLRWDEVLSLKGDGANPPRILKLKIAGAELQILDLYEESLTEIGNLISQNLRPG